jgi:hypothetical protein
MPFTAAPIEARSRNRRQVRQIRKPTMNFSPELFAGLLLNRRRQDDEVRRNDLFEDLRAARERQRKRS